MLQPASKNNPLADYETRSAAYGFASQNEVIAASKQSNVVFLDVRTPQEVKVARLHPPGAFVAVSVNPDEAPELVAQSSTLLPNKMAPVIVYCASGQRAAQAKKVLKKQGYKTVLNAGALSDLGYLNMKV